MHVRVSEKQRACNSCWNPAQYYKFEDNCLFIWKRVCYLPFLVFLSAAFVFFIWIASGEVEVGLNRARVQSGMIRKDFEQLVVDVQSGQHTIKKELQELKKIVHAVIPTAKGEEERENIETWVERLEAVCKRLEKCLSHLYAEESVKEGPEQDTTSVGKSSNQISAALRDLVENLKMIYESWREFAEISLKRENTLWSDKNDRPLGVRQGKDGMTNRSQKDTEQIYEEQRKCDGATTDVLHEGGFKLDEIVQASSFEHPFQRD